MAKRVATEFPRTPQSNQKKFKPSLTPAQRSKRMESMLAALSGSDPASQDSIQESPSKTRNEVAPAQKEKRDRSILEGSSQASNAHSQSSIEEVEVTVSVPTDDVDEEDVFWGLSSGGSRESSRTQGAGSSTTSRLPVNGTPEVAPVSAQNAPMPWTSTTPRGDAYPHAGNGNGQSSASDPLLTPPRSSQPDLDDYGSAKKFLAVDAVPQTPTRTKGKERDLTSQWHRIQSDPENPFHDRAAALQTPLRNAGVGDTPSTDSGTPKAATASSIIESSLGLVRKLERKGLADQKSIETKNNRISELEKEKTEWEKEMAELKSKVQILEEKNKFLEHTLEAVRTRR